MIYEHEHQAEVEFRILSLIVKDAVTFGTHGSVRELTKRGPPLLDPILDPF
jgi:hypothetical protein